MSETANLLLLGTGTVGASLGLALGRSSASFHRIGFDPDRRRLRSARQNGSIDRSVNRAGEAAGEADLVLLTLGGEAARRALKDLAGRLRPDVVVLGASSMQSGLVESWRSELGPANPYVATVPFYGPRRAFAAAEETQRPAPDLFEGGLLGIAAPPGTPEGAIDVALDLAKILGTHPFFLEPAELDSAAATSEQLPALLAAAVLESLSANPGWRDQRRLVGPLFARLMGLVEELEAQGVAAELAANRFHLSARLEALIEALTALRASLEAADEEALERLFDRAGASYRDWRTIRVEDRPDHGYEPPRLPGLGLLDRLLGRRPRR
jgi:prephenate dehydrogenase